MKDSTLDLSHRDEFEDSAPDQGHKQPTVLYVSRVL